MEEEERAMSIDRCLDCGAFLDTDADPEVYREEFRDEPLCDVCYEERLIAKAEGGD